MTLRCQPYAACLWTLSHFSLWSENNFGSRGTGCPAVQAGMSDGRVARQEKSNFSCREKNYLNRHLE